LKVKSKKTEKETRTRFFGFHDLRLTPHISRFFNFLTFERGKVENGKG